MELKNPESEIKELKALVLYSEMFYLQEEEIDLLYRMSNFLSSMLYGKNDDLLDKVNKSQNFVENGVVSTILHKETFGNLRKRQFSTSENRLKNMNYLKKIDEIKNITDTRAEALFLAQEYEIKSIFYNNLIILKALEDMLEVKGEDFLMFYIFESDYLRVYDRGVAIMGKNNIFNRGANEIKMPKDRVFNMSKDVYQEFHRLIAKNNKNCKKFKEEELKKA